MRSPIFGGGTVPNGRGMLVKVLRVGVDGTDKEINAAEYGAAPPGYDFLVIGHEGFGQVEAVFPHVSELTVNGGSDDARRQSAEWLAPFISTSPYEFSLRLLSQSKAATKWCTPVASSKPGP